MNCIVVDDDELSRSAMEHLVQQVEFLTLVRSCSSAIEASNVLLSETADLVLLDIEMPGMNGLEWISSMEKKPLIILATAKKEYALEAFEHQVVDYLVKPVAHARFLKAVTKARAIFESTRQAMDLSDKETIFIKSNAVLHKINTNDILWIEALGDYTLIHTVSDQRFTLHSTMKAIEKKLSAEKFVRVHRAFIVALQHISSIEDTTIIMDKKLIPIGAVYRENFMKRLNLL